MLPISIMLKLFGSTCLAGGFLYHENKRGIEDSPFYCSYFRFESRSAARLISSGASLTITTNRIMISA